MVLWVVIVLKGAALEQVWNIQGGDDASDHLIVCIISTGIYKEYYCHRHCQIITKTF